MPRCYDDRQRRRYGLRYPFAVRVLVLFFSSGLASLLLETVYRRQLTLLLGSAVTATSITLATFLAGLAWGAAALGPRADRSASPLGLYGRLEVGVALTGAAAVGAMTYGCSALLAPARAVGPWAAILVAAILILPSTFLMGGTLPALVRRAPRAVAVLYGINTLGAACGAALSGFVLFERIGVSATGWLGAALAGAVGTAALLSAREEAAPVVEEPAQPAGPGSVLVAAALGGAAALGYEVLWTRLLALPLRSYGYSFSLMLTLFLLGLVAGALLLAWAGPRVRRPFPLLAAVQLAGGAYVAASVLWLPRLLAAPREGGGFGAFVLGGALHAAPLVLPPTILSGIAFPLAVRSYTTSTEGAGRAAGRVTTANVLGSIAGALAAGLLLLPALGAPRSLAVLGAIGALGGAAAAWAAWPPRFRWVAVAVPLACCLGAAVSDRPFRDAYSRTRAGDRVESLFFRESATDTVAVVRRGYGFRDPDAKSVIVNGIAMTATVKPVWRYMAAEGHLPALLAPAPSKALVICVGTGITLEALASHASVASIDAVDLSEGILEALPVFAHENREAFRDPRVRLVHADGRHHLELTRAQYDLITLEPPPPIVAGSVHLYTLDFYRLCRRHLNSGGVVAQWLPLHAQSLASARATARTFLEAFPHAQLWLPSIRDAVLIGSDRELRPDPERFRAAFADPRTRASLDAAYLETPEALAATYLLDRDGIARWSAGADLVTDDRPSIEFFRPYGRNMTDAEIGTLLDAGVAPALFPGLEAERDAHLDYVRAEATDDRDLARRAAVAARATRFGRYRFGCDEPQLAALAAEDPSKAAKQRETCERLFGE
jgi:spermidine synthase